MKNRKLKPFLWVILTSIFSLLLVLPLFKSGFWQSDDGGWMVVRFSAFHQSLKDGHFPVRLADRLNRGYGYPVFNFLYPLPFYLAEIFHLLGFGFIASIKAVFICTTLLSAVGFFLLAKQITGKNQLTSAWLAAGLYVFAPYRQFLLYKRGSLGESTALAVAPFLFYFLDRALRKPDTKNISLIGLFSALLILSHNVMALLFIPLVLLFILEKKKKKSRKASANIFLGLGFGLLLSAFFWVPALWELKYTRASQLVISNYQNYYLSARQLLSFLGPLNLAVVILALLGKKRLFALLALFLIFALHPTSFFLVTVFPLLTKIQFPWRMTAVFIFLSAYLFPFVFAKIKTVKVKNILSLLIPSCLLILTFTNFKNYQFFEAEDSYYSTNDDSTTVKNEFTPIWVSEDPQNMPPEKFKVETLDNRYQVLISQFKTGYKFLQLRIYDRAKVTFFSHYFPGWQVYVDGQKIALEPDKTHGLFVLNLNPGRDNIRDIKLIFESTPIQKLANCISLLAFLLLISYPVFKKWGKDQPVKTASLLITGCAVVSFCYSLFTNFSLYTQKFDALKQEEAYNNSQWVNPYPDNIPIGDSGLYLWAGYKYAQGINPTLINPEMPPLGKYLIGWGILLIRRPAVVALLTLIFALVTYYFLARKILSDFWLALMAVSLLSLEPLVKSLLSALMLDGIQLGFLNLCFLFFIKGISERKWFSVSSLMLGAVISTKFFILGLVAALSLICCLILTGNRKGITAFSFSLPLAFLVHLASYARYFAFGNGFLDYLKVQKWIFTFYRQGNVGTVPLGSYWLLVFGNRWLTWFSEKWGESAGIRSEFWRFSWPVNLLASAAAVWLTSKKKLKFNSGEKVILSWLISYSLFLTFIIGWPHYLLLFLPYSYLILIKLSHIFMQNLKTAK